MRPCEEVRRWLDAYADDQLARSDRREVEAHLAACAQCREELEWLRALQRGIAAEAAGNEPPDSYFETLPDRVRDRFDFDAAERAWQRSAGGKPPARRALPAEAGVWAQWALGLVTVLSVVLVVRVARVGPLRPETVELRAREMSRVYETWQKDEAAQRPAERNVARDIATDRQAAIPPDARIAMEAPAFDLADWGRELRALLAAGSDVAGAAGERAMPKAVAAPAPAPPVPAVTTTSRDAPASGSLLASEGDAAYPDSLWVSAWRSEARLRAELALQSPAPDGCRDALEAYRKVAYRGGRPLFPERGALARALEPDRDRIERLLSRLGW